MKAMPRWTRLRDESGQVLVLTAISMTALLGMTALAVDVGLLYRTKRNIQIAADAGATAGTLDYFNTQSSSSAITAAENAATANGFTDGVNGATVVVTNPVTSGPHTGPATVKVVITHANPTIFMRILGRNSMTVGAKAVAGLIAPQDCVFINQNLIAKGNATIEGYDTARKTPEMGCGVYAKSGVNVTGNGNTFNVVHVVTSGSESGNHNTNPAPVITNAPVEKVPSKLRITPPSPLSYPSCNPPTGYTLPTTGKNKGIISATLYGSITPGCYGLGTTGATAMNIDLGGATTTMANGMYVFDLGANGTLTLDNNVSGGSKAQGSGGVTLDINTGNFSATSTTNDSLYAPSDGSTYDGILLLEPSSNTGVITFQWGSSSGSWYGYIVAPQASATMQDQGGAPLVTGMVLGNLTINGTLNLNNYGNVYTNAQVQSVALVE